tara:strand:- start:21 stop:224 length:204 start_codon:yes stop_codon:yes gene_type:complete
MLESKPNLNIGDLARYCLDTIIVYPKLEELTKYYYMKALSNWEKGEAENVACQIAIININDLIKGRL